MSRLNPLVLLALFLPVPAGAQSAADWRDSAQRIGRDVRALRDSMIQGDSTMRELVHRGKLVLSASANDQGMALEGFEYFEAARSRWFGTAFPSPNGFRIVVRVAGKRGFRGLWWQETASSLILAGLPDTGTAVRVERVVPPENSGLILMDAFGEMMHESAEASVRKWMRRPPPLFLPDEERRELAMYAVVTGTGAAQRGCVEGKIADCAYALGLRDPTRAEPGPPYDPIVRADLLLAALETGGAEAWIRLNQPVGGNIDAVLAAAASIPSDSLIARWRRDVLALQPNTAPLEPKQVIAILAWTVLLVFGALGVARWA